MTDLQKIRRGMETLVEKLKYTRFRLRMAEARNEHSIETIKRLLKQQLLWQDVLLRLQTLGRTNPEFAVQILSSAILNSETGLRALLNERPADEQ